MPKGVYSIHPERIDQLRILVENTVGFSLHSNTNFEVLSDFIFKQTGDLLSKSTLRRVFQFNPTNKPTEATLELICKSIGFGGWDDFNQNESFELQFEIEHYISIIRLNGIIDREFINKILAENRENPYLVSFLDAVIQSAIANRDITFLKDIFTLFEVFENLKHFHKIYFLSHTLVISLLRSGLMNELIPHYGANNKAQSYLVEWYVDEDNLSGYYYDLLQVYHQNKNTPEALLFYNCLMYQHAMKNNLDVCEWALKVSNFKDNNAIHPIPRARRFAILLIEAKDNPEILEKVRRSVVVFINSLIEIDKILISIILCRMLFKKRCDGLLGEILSLLPERNGINADILSRIHRNQLIIYEAYNLYNQAKLQEASLKLSRFNPLLVDLFWRNSTLSDFKVISTMINGEM